MRMVVGLGNPGKKYETSRHNLGFLVIDQVAGRLGLGGWRTQLEAEVVRGQSSDGSYLLVKPQTFVNLSGRAVGALARYYRIEPPDCLVVVDDLELDTGRLRTRDSGGHGGHNGLRSLIEHLGGGEFKRIRIGIGRPPPGMPVVGHVLGTSPGEESERLGQATEEATERAMRFIETGQFDIWSSPTERQ